jgi:hypothetical protein
VAWFLATYVGPVVLLMRSPSGRRTNIALGVAYLVLLLTFSWVSSHAVRLEIAGSGDESGSVIGTLRELVQPLRW